MQYTIRQLAESEYPLLKDFLYECIFVPPGATPPDKSILQHPELQVYIDGFGRQPEDYCLVAESDQQLIGAAWVRIMEDYGHVDQKTPSLALSVFKSYRGQGVGTALMKELLKDLKAKGYEQTSLAVQKANYACKMYQSLGYEIVREKDEEFIMVKKLG